MRDMLKAKFRCVEVRLLEGAEEARLQPVMDGSEENKTFSKATPSGELRLYVSNSDVAGYFKPGKEYLLDITPAE